MYQLVLNLPFDVVLASKQTYQTPAAAEQAIKNLNLPDGFEIVRIDHVPANAVVLPLGKATN